MTAIIDEALARGSSDLLDVQRYSDALSNFIQQANTPITIGVQGEWGSGKTSMLNQIWHQLDSQGYRQVWVNAWEHTLLSNPEQALVKILGEIIDELLLMVDKRYVRTEALKKGLRAVMQGAVKIGSSYALGPEAKKAVENFFESDMNAIKKLRSELDSLVAEIRDSDELNTGKVVVYIDDLDRIDPPEAVRILELLKNVFNVKGCIFVLAIDYHVVVKGLKSKFGEPTAENEWEFRAFFDKIIQLPFMMPMGAYNIGAYLRVLLNDIKFFSSDDSVDEDFIERMVQLTVGGNPRSIKRLVNCLSLILQFHGADTQLGDEQEAKYAHVLFGLVCLQIAFPEIYDLLTVKPNFQDWDDDFAYEVTQKAEEINNLEWEKNFEIATGHSDFNDAWEQALFRICYVKPKLRKHAANISRALSMFVYNLGLADIDTVFRAVLQQTSVTSVCADDQATFRPPKGSYKKLFNSGIADWKERVRADFAERSMVGFPSDKLFDYVEQLVENIKNSMGACDYNPDEQSEFYIKYSSFISIHYNKKKIMHLLPMVRKSGEYLEYLTLKNAEHDFRLMKLGHTEFSHVSRLTIDPDDPRKVQGGTYRSEYQLLHQSAAELLPSQTVLSIIECAMNTRGDNVGPIEIASNIEEWKAIIENRRIQASSAKYQEARRLLEEHYAEDRFFEIP